MIYATAHLFLFASFLLFVGLRWVVSSTKGVRSSVWLRFAQVLLLLAVLAPAVGGLLATELPTFEPTAPVSMVFQDVDSASETGAPALPESSPPLSRVQQWGESVPVSSADFWFWVFVTSVLLGLSRAASGVVEVRRALFQCVLVRHIGRVQVLVSPAGTPWTTRGLRNVWIVVPENLLPSPRQLRLAIQHEAQHHRQGDCLWMLVGEVLKTLFFLNPAIHLWTRTIGEYQELACDEALITVRGARPLDYGNCLLQVAENQILEPRPIFGTAGMSRGGSGSLLKRRIEMLGSHRRGSSRFTMTALFALLGIGFVGGIAYASHSKRESDKASFLSSVHVPIQKIAEKELIKGVRNAGARSGFAVVADPATGEILASAHVQKRGTGFTVDSEVSGFLKNAQNPLSTAKPFVLAEGIEIGRFTPDETFDCGSGSLQVDGVEVRDWRAFGKITATGVIAQSSTIGAVKMAQAIGSDKLTAKLSDFGFSAVPKTTLDAAAGQGAFQVTPLEMVAAYSALANGGNLMKPIAYKGTAQRVRQVVSAKTSDAVRKVLQKVVLEGTGAKAATGKYSTAGKTGSSPKIVDKDGSTYAALASFVGFAPVQNPRVVIYVGIEKAPVAHGGAQAAPVFSKLAEAALKTLGVASDL